MEQIPGSLPIDIGTPLAQLDTPVAVVDTVRMEANISRLQAYLDTHKLANRPHIKTHKIPAIAQKQINAGAVGITCQKIGEAEIMARAGLTDILITFNLLGMAKLERLMTLCRTAHVSVTADSMITVIGLSNAAVQHGVVLPVLVEFDTGHGRCGVQSPNEAVELACNIAHLPGLQFAGLMTFPANEHTDPFVNATKSLLVRDHLYVERVSIGGTPGKGQAHTYHHATEYRAGTYIFGDRATVRSGAMTFGDCALSVRTTVVSRPTCDRGILDAGSKTLSSDLLGFSDYGHIVQYPEASIKALSEEHATVDFSACSHKPEIGECVTVLPNHCCVVTNLFNQLVGVREGRVETIWDVAARGALR